MYNTPYIKASAGILSFLVVLQHIWSILFLFFFLNHVLKPQNRTEPVIYKNTDFKDIV